MTGTPGELISSGPPRERRSRTRSLAVLTEASITSACVAAGVAVAMTVLPERPTPARVAESFVEARFAEDWAEAWSLLCGRDQDRVDYETFADEAARQHVLEGRPSDVDIAVGDLRSARRSADPQFTVPMTLVFDERDGDRVIEGNIPLVAEDDTVRVCFTASDPGA